MSDQQTTQEAKRIGREWPKYGLALAAVLVACFGLLLALNADGLRIFFGQQGHQATAPITMTVVHSNDTFGYLEGCG